MKNDVTILGAGAWGTAVATVLANNGFRVKLWCYEPEVAQEIKKTGQNERYLYDVHLDRKIEAVASLAEACDGASWIFEAIPIKFLRSILEQCKPFYSDEQTWVALSKGIENETLLFPTQIIDDVFGAKVDVAVASGPSFAYELAKKNLTGITVAARHKKKAQELSNMLACHYVQPDVSDDLFGVQLGGALKNVITVAIGILEGAGYGDNTQALLFTRGFQELIFCAPFFGAQSKTLLGLSGIGDLVLTSMGGASRNLAVGERLGGGQELSMVLQETGFVPEGINTIRSMRQLCQKHNLDLPLLCGLHEVVFEGKKIEQLLERI